MIYGTHFLFVSLKPVMQYLTAIQAFYSLKTVKDEIIAHIIFFSTFLVFFLCFITR